MSYFNGARLRRIRELKRMSLTEVFESTGISRAQISRIENGKADPRMSTVTQLLSCYGASLSDLESSSPGVLSLGEVKRRANQASERLVLSGLGPSDAGARLDRKAERQVDIRAEREALSTRA